jgi:hypothetical protein
MARIYFHGNCQAVALSKYWREHFPNHEIHANHVHSMDVSDLQNYEWLCKSSDIIVSQVISDTYRDEFRLSTSWIRENKKAGCVLIVFPVMFYRGQTPQSFYIHGISGFKSTYHDAHLIDLLCRGYQETDILASVMSEQFLAPEIIDAVCNQTISETASREQLGKVDITVSDLYQRYQRSKLLFNSINHPTRFVMLRVMERVLACLGARATLQEEGEDFLAEVVIPPYPSVASHLGIGGVTNLNLYRVNHDPETADSFLRGLLLHYKVNVGTEELTKSVQQNTQLRAYLDMCHSKQHGFC